MERKDLPNILVVEKLREMQLAEHMRGDYRDYSEPRLIDPLHPKLEKAWSVIVQSVIDTDVLTVPAMGRVWADTELPQPIRDRSLLAAYGAWPVRRYLGFESQRSTFGGRNSFGLPEHLRPEYDETLRLATDRQHQTGIEILSQASYLYRVLGYFKGGQIDSAKLDDYLGTIDIQEVHSGSIFEGALPRWIFDSYGEYLDYSRPPLLSEILVGIYGSDKKLQKWAFAKLDQVLQRQLDPTLPEVSPEWLGWVDETKMFQMCNWLLLQDKLPPKDKPHFRDLMLKRWGWEILLHDLEVYPSRKLTLKEGLGIYETLDDDAERLSILEHVLRLNKQRREKAADGEPIYDSRKVPEVVFYNRHLKILEDTLVRVPQRGETAKMIRAEVRAAKKERARQNAEQKKLTNKIAADKKARAVDAAAKEAERTATEARLQETLNSLK